MFMDLGGPGENIAPDEGGGGGEALSEEAKARFAGAAAAQQQARKDEKKAKKRDDGVAQMIMRFLSDTQRIHLATLISRLVALDCPSPFLLAVLSLVNAESAKAVEEYLAEQGAAPDIDTRALAATLGDTKLPVEANENLEKWILSMELVLATNPAQILKALLVEEGNIDGTVLQLTTFVLDEFMKSHGKAVPFPALQGVSVSILQSVFENYMHHAPLPAPKQEEDE